MRRGYRMLASLALGTAFLSPALIAGCASGHARMYDAGYGDYHTWDANENVYYVQWETNTHRDHQDFKRRNADEQKEYWTWRHSNQKDDRHDNDHH